MIILGTKPAQHDACFALLKDGQPLFIYEQERFNRVKHGMSSDLSVLFDAIREYDIRPEDIDLITNCIDHELLPQRQEQVRNFLHGPALENMEDYLTWRLPVWHRLLVGAGFPEEKIVNIRHHLCHCAGVYYSSPAEEAAILSVDGSGETETAMLAHGVDGKITILRTTPHPSSLGHFYQAVTFWLGWGFGEEGKTMALASYGTGRYCGQLLDQFIEVDETGFFQFKPIDGSGSCGYSSQELTTLVFERLFGAARAPHGPISQLHKDVAASVQKICDDVMLNSARFLKRVTGAKTLLLAGGVGLNSVSNGRILRERIFENVQAYPQANDTGTALGGSLYAYHNLLGLPDKRSRWVMTHAYWGKKVDLENVEQVAARYGLRGQRQTSIYEVTADLLNQGLVVGWVQGRAEVGPRALGNRSILGNPLIPGMKDKINRQIKHREMWRPFAPSVLREDASLYFEADQDLPYMTVVATIRPKWRQQLSSVGHVDATARVQTVTEEGNLPFYTLLRAFKAKTGIGILLNTSFNDRGEPLVQTCEQAVQLFIRSQMDALVIGDWLFVEKPIGVEVPAFAPYRVNFDKLPQTRLLVVCNEPCAPFAEMMAYLAGLNRQARFSVPESASAQSIPDARERFVKPEEINLKFLADYDALVFFVPHSGDRFVFDRRLYYSDFAQFSREAHEHLGLPIFWVDINGDVTLMDTLLYIHHGERKPLGRSLVAR